jgi:hypothetical protein
MPIAFGTAFRIILLKSVALAMPRLRNNPNRREYDEIRCICEEFMDINYYYIRLYKLWQIG